jgi:hypothetical protein
MMHFVYNGPSVITITPIQMLQRDTLWKYVAYNEMRQRSIAKYA